VNSTLIAFGYQAPLADLLGHGGRQIQIPGCASWPSG
jgi:hypothetical protein